jgi:hypothetical protein
MATKQLTLYDLAEAASIAIDAIDAHRNTLEKMSAEATVEYAAQVKGANLQQAHKLLQEDMAESGLLPTFNRMVQRYANPQTPTIIRTNWGCFMDHETLGAMALHHVEWPTLALAAAIRAGEQFPERFGEATSLTDWRDKLRALELERDSIMAKIDAMLQLLADAQLIPGRISESVVNWYRTQRTLRFAA